MAVEKMTMVTLSGPMDMVDEAIRYFVINRDFHPENAVAALKNVRRLTAFEAVNDYAEPLAEACALASELGVELQYRDFSAAGLTREKAAEQLSALRAKLEDARERLAAREKDLDEKQRAASQLLHIGGIDENLYDLLHMKYAKFRFGGLPAAFYEGCLQLIKNRDDVFYIRTGDVGDDGKIYGVYFVLPGSVEQVDSIFSAQHFERIRLDKSLSGTASATREDLDRAVEEDKTAVEELKREIASLAEDRREELLQTYCYLRFMSECCSLRQLAGYHNDSFYIVGWIPKSGESAFIDELGQMADTPFSVSPAEAAGEKGEKHMLVVWAPSGDGQAVIRETDSVNEFSCVLSDGTGTSAKPPVKLKSGFFAKIYAPFVEMYGLPSYGEMDPRFFMAITYTLIFGIMYGDIGQGLVLSCLGFALWKAKKMWLGRILALCGLSSAVFGVVYGSVFGYEDLLPGYKVLEGENTMNILLAAVALGALLLLICMAVNIVNSIRQRDIGKTLFSPNGLAGFIMYFAVAAGVVAIYVFDLNLFSAPYIIFLIVLPLLCIFAQAPLTRLCEGRKDWLPERIGMFFVEGFFELFETVLAYVSNTISFLRVGAFAISHAGMMMVVMLLSSDGKNIFGVVLGNIVVMGIEGMLVCIQVLRLEFYEMFGRFYTGGGEKFSPRVIDYSKKA